MTIGEKKTSYTCYPEWGRYGVRVEYKPKRTWGDKEYSASILISEVMRDGSAQDGFRFTTRPLNDKQRTNGKYNPHASCAFDAIPQLIAALLSLRQDYTENDDGSVEGIPQADAIRRDVQAQDANDAIDQDVFAMGEFAAAAPKPKQKKAPDPKIEGDDDLPF